MLNQLRPYRFRPDEKPVLECPPPLITPTFDGDKQVGVLITPIDESGKVVPPEPPEKPYSAYGVGGHIPLGGVMRRPRFRDSGVNKSPNNQGGEHISIWDRITGSRLSWDEDSNHHAINGSVHWTEKDNTHHQGRDWLSNLFDPKK